MSADPKPVAPPRRRVVRVLLGLIALILLVWAAPMIAAVTPLVGWVCGKYATFFDGTIHVGSASLGWFSPIRLNHVELRGADGELLAQIPKIESDRSLLNLLFDRDDLGSFRIDHPTIEWTFSKDDSNFEMALLKRLHGVPEAKPGGAAPGRTTPQFRLEVVDGTLNMRDAVVNQTWRFKALMLSAMFFNDDARTVQLTVNGTTHDGTEAGAVKAEILLQDLGTPEAKATIKGRFTSAPVMLASVIARRYHPGIELSGSLQGQFQLNASLHEGKPHVEASGEFIGNHVLVVSPALADTFYVERFRAPFALRLDDRNLIVQRVEVDSEFGKLTAQGALDFDADWRAALAQPDFDLDLNLRLATLGQRLPKTLHMQLDMWLLAGELNVQCKSQARDGAIVWQGHLHTSDVRGIRGNQHVAWAEPIMLDFQARNLHEGIPAIDYLRCNSRFLRIDTVNEADQFTLRADADLKQLAEALGQFIKFGDVKLEGKANASLSVRRTGQDFIAHGDAQCKDLKLSWLTRQPWHEQTITAKLNARGQVAKDGRQRFDAADLDVNLGSDHISMKLTEPIIDAAAGPWGALAVRVDGDLTRWHQRVRSWTPRFDDWQLAGQADLQLQVRPSAQAIDCTSAQLLATNCRLTSSSCWIQEPIFSVKTAARWDAKSGQIDLKQSKLSSFTLEIKADKLFLQPATMSLAGSVNIVGDVARLRQWIHDPKTKPDEPMAGTLVGRVDLHSNEDQIVADVNVALKNVIYGNPAHPTWQEADLKCIGRGVYDRAADLLDLEKITLGAAALGVDGKGRIAHLTTTRDLELSGKMTYDLEKLEPQLRPFLGKDVKIAGKDTRPYNLGGPLRPSLPLGGGGSSLSYRGLKGETALNWKSLKALGCDVGPAETKAVLQQGWLQLFPVETTFNGGKLRLQPNIKLEPGPMEIILLAGPIIENAKITREMCAGALGHAMPVLANVADAEGSISLTLEGGRIPLAMPSESEVKGTFVLRNAKVGPNAIVREVSQLLRIEPPTGVVKDCQVPFYLHGGKVHHANLELTVGEFTMKSSGAVGLDGSLAIVIETPIPRQLADAARLTSAQAKQTLRIPIGGTLEHPRIDPQVLESLAAVLGRSLLENELNRLLPKR